MSNKMTCPGCGAHLSSVRYAFDHDEPCPECGLSAGAALEILAVQQSRADESLKQRLTDALARAGKAETKARDLEEAVWQIRDVLDSLEKKRP